VFGGLASIVVSESLDLVSLVVIAFRRAANFGFLRLATLALAQAFDLATFNIMVARHGMIAEANPLVHQLFGSMGMSAIVFAKLAIVLLTAALCLAASARGGRGVWAVVGGLPLAIGIAGGLIGGITNTATFLH
jgi:hypothetical protein